MKGPFHPDAGRHREVAIVAGRLTIFQSQLTGLSFAATLVSLALLALGLATSSLHLTGYGLASSFPLTFYAGLVLLTFAACLLWFRTAEVLWLALLQITALIAALWLAPYILDTGPHFRTAFSNYGYVDRILREGRLDPKEAIYHNWPLFAGLFAGLVKGLRIDADSLMSLFPFAMAVAYLGPLVFLVRTLLPSCGNKWTGAILLFYLFNWTQQDYFSPQALAFLFFLVFAAIAARAITHNAGRLGPRLTALAILLYTAIVLTHFLTSLIALALIGTLNLGGQLRGRQLIMSGALILVAWQAYGAFEFFSQYHSRLVETLLAPENFLGSNLVSRASGSPAHAVITRLRITSTLLAFGVAAVGWLAARESRALSQASHFALVYLFAVAAIVPLSAYGGEMLIRVLLFSLPALGLLLVDGMGNRTVMIFAATVFVISAPLHILTHYGNYEYDFVSQDEREGFSFINSQLRPANIYGGFPAGAFQNLATIDWRNATLPSPATLDDYLHPDDHKWRHRDWPTYVILDRGDGVAFDLFYGQPFLLQSVKDELKDNCHFKLVFYRPDFTIYRWNGACVQGN